MRQLIKSILRKLGLDLSGWSSSRFNRRYARQAPRTFSQYGEDAVLRGFMDRRCRTSGYRGFWVDVGAHHPTRFSNTRLFHELGWRGINVDALPSAIDLFRKYRPNDINVWAGIGPSKGELDFYCFDDPAYDTFSRDRLETLGREWGHVLKAGEDYSVRKVPMMTLGEILEKYLPRGQKIDFMTIDAEGLDQKILKSNDWTRYRPDFILVEDSEGGIGAFLSSCGYSECARGVNTNLYRQ